MNTELLSLVPQEKRAAAENYLKTRQSYPPKLVQGMLLIGALISSLSVLWGGAILFGWKIPMVVIGAVFTVFGWWLAYKNQNRADFAYVFCAQLGLMFGIIGRMELIDFLCALAHHKLMWEAVIVAAVAAVSYPVFKMKIDRLFFCGWALCLLTYYLARYSFSPWIENIWLCGLFGAALWIFSARRVRFKPLAYACLAACAFGVFFHADTGFNLFRVLAAGLAAFCASRLPLAFKTRALLCGGIVILACWLNLPAFLGLFACAAGYYLRERYVEWLGLAGFSAGFIYMYYDMQATLLQKSGWLTLSGVCVLAAYAWVRRKYAR